ncbi:MAG: hypothetical protein N2317_03930 [Syntrophales bacterium]|nr:hypothetical protein [Syntrophales bacterium]
MKKISLFDHYLTGVEVDFEKFNELEERIKSVLNEYGRLRKKIKEYEEILKQRELELEEIKKKNRDLIEERETIRSKVDFLLDLLEDIQNKT